MTMSCGMRTDGLFTFIYTYIYSRFLDYDDDADVIYIDRIKMKNKIQSPNNVNLIKIL